jgi:hypothetical protein
MRSLITAATVAAIAAALISSGQTTVKTRIYNARLLRVATNAWQIPSTATNVCVYVNGLRYRPGGDYSIAAGKVTALANTMPADALVIADYDQ